MTNKSVYKSHGSLRLVLGAGLILMLGSACLYLTEHPSLVVHTSQTAGSQAASGSAAGVSADASSPIMQLMQHLQHDPNDVDTLVKLADLFLHQDDPVRAENFALRAKEVAPDNVEALYLLAIARHQQQRHAEAAASLEAALAIKDSADMRYSLGVLYIYFLNQPDKGRAMLQAALTAPGLSESLKAHIQAELAKK
ncbi:MAG TPA: hypothetical protein IAB01_07465 [Candidatus Avidesulfovibrio excrementigallinarum]|nr:hypothetical protein [Candidatus Avidesulfovibrio excrementigallinarum]